MLYLAEVHKKSGFISNKTELKLLARQQLEQSWSAISGEEFLATEEANNFNAGTLVLVELTANRQIQSIQEASRQLVGILQNFSRLQEKFRTQAEEIEGWKQSLIYQSQELTHRKLEMEAWQDELQQSEEALKELEDQRQAVEVTREEVQRQREEAERNRQGLENVWSQLQSLGNLLSQLSGAIIPAGSVQEHLNTTLELITQQQAILDQYWQKLQQQSVLAQNRQAELEHQTSHMKDLWKEWQQVQDSLQQACVELKLRQQSLRLREEYAHTLALQLQAQKDLYQQLSWLTSPDDEADMQVLEEMPLEELKLTVEELQQGLGKVSRFVHDQEEELTLQHQAVEELQERIKQVSEDERPDLEADLEFEQQRYQMLSETLVGQRRSLREREAILNKHQTVLLQRQAKDQDAKQSKLEQLELTLQNQKSELSELWGRINTYQEILQPIQDHIIQLRQQLTSVAQSLQQVSDQPVQAIAEIKNIMTSLTQVPELATL